MSDQNVEYKVKCPKGMKLPKAVKAQAALMKGRSKEFKKAWMRSMGIAIHEAATKVRMAARSETNKQRMATEVRTSANNASIDVIE